MRIQNIDKERKMLKHIRSQGCLYYADDLWKVRDLRRTRDWLLKIMKNHLLTLQEKYQ